MQNIGSIPVNLSKSQQWGNGLKNSKHPVIVRIIELVSVFSLHLCLFIPRAYLDPNAIHDGIMFAAAISFSEGGVPNKNAFNQYGPLNSIIQGSWLNLFGDNLLTLRIFSALVLAFTGLLMVILIKHKLGFSKSLLISLIWNLGPPLFLPSTLPWSSSLSTLLLLLFLLSVKQFDQAKVCSNVSAVIGSMLLTLSIFLRIHMLLLVIMVLVYLIIQNKKTKNRSSLLLSFSIGQLLSLFIVTIYFKSTQSWTYFYDQGIKWPFFGIATRESLVSSQQFIIFIAGAVIPAVALIGILMVRVASKKSFRSNKIRVYSCILIFMSSAIYIANLQITPVSFKNPLFVIKIFCQNLPQVVNFLFLFVFIMMVVKTRFLYKLTFSKADTFNELLLISSSALLFQLYPSADQLHIWWIIPTIAVAVIFNSNKKLVDTNSFLRSKIAGSVLISMLASLLLYQGVEISQKRIPFKSDTLNGMYGKPPESAFIDLTMVNLEKFQRTGHKVRIHCGEAIYSATSRGYLSIDQYYLEMDGLVKVGAKGSKFDFYCNLEQKQKNLIMKRSVNTIFVVASDDNKFNLLVRNGI